MGEERWLHEFDRRERGVGQGRVVFWKIASRLSKEPLWIFGVSRDNTIRYTKRDQARRQEIQ